MTLDKRFIVSKRVRVLVMYSIFIYSGDSLCPDGWFKSLNIHKNVQSNTSGERRMTPVTTEDDSLAKKWKTADGAINYAKSLAKKLKTVTYRGNMLPSYRYLHSLDYSITVFDWDNKCNIFSIGMNKYTSSQSR